MLDTKAKLALKVQELISFINLFWMGPLFLVLNRFVFLFYCRGLYQLRSEVRSHLAAAGNDPVILCSNHLTKIDSILLNMYLFSFRDIIRQFKLLPWNIPEFSRFKYNPVYRIVCYLGKCINIRREGSAAAKKSTMEKVKYLLAHKHMVCIFPEGQRSRTGRVNPENTVYGVGSIMQEIKNCKILCAYIRGDQQSSFSAYPKRGDSFYVGIKLLAPTTTEEGRRGAKNLSLQIVNSIKEMEDDYFANRERHCRPEDFIATQKISRSGLEREGIYHMEKP